MKSERRGWGEQWVTPLLWEEAELFYARGLSL
jgi:hypothetical protein